jgi:hypothetical protein
VTAAFAHDSERRFAALLDFYRIEWRYEPRTFELERDEHGIRRAFTPDFYLPAYDVYVEITTLRQKLVTKKNRKVRELRERYPDVRLVVLYQRDLAALDARQVAPCGPAPRDATSHRYELAALAG